MKIEIKRRWQQTFDVNGQKITVIIKTRSRVGNSTGYAAEVHDNQGHKLTIPAINVLEAEKAQEIAYVRFVREFC